MDDLLDELVVPPESDWVAAAEGLMAALDVVVRAVVAMAAVSASSTAALSATSPQVAMPIAATRTAAAAAESHGLSHRVIAPPRSTVKRGGRRSPSWPSSRSQRSSGACSSLASSAK